MTEYRNREQLKHDHQLNYSQNNKKRKNPEISEIPNVSQMKKLDTQSLNELHTRIV